MRVPEWLSERVPPLDALEDNWQPVSRWAFAGWMLFYALCLWGAAAGRGIPRWIDLVFVPVHEGGHLLFRFFGQWVAVAGGTFLQLLVPCALAVYFIFQRQVPGTAFCVFFFFEQFLPIGVYMADARAQALPLVTVGDSEYVVHDWFYLFNSIGVLQHDRFLGASVRILGWIGMLGTVGWAARRGWSSSEVSRG